MTEGHDPGCDMAELSPSLGQSTKPCHCMAKVARQRDEAIAAEAAVRRQLAGVEARYHDALTVLRWLRDGDETDTLAGLDSSYLCSAYEPEARAAFKRIRADVEPEKGESEAVTEHCECGAPPDDADESHACIRGVEPLRACVARALGCHVVVETDISGGMARSESPGAIYLCGCMGDAWHCGCADITHESDRDCELAPYGEDTPEGWACTGPLVRRFGLGLSIPRAYSVVEGGVAVFAIGARGRDAFGPHACAAIAEWVAEHGAAAIASEKA